MRMPLQTKPEISKEISYQKPRRMNEMNTSYFLLQNLFLVASKVVWMIPIKNPDVGHIAQSKTYWLRSNDIDSSVAILLISDMSGSKYHFNLLIAKTFPTWRDFDSVNFQA